MQASMKGIKRAGRKHSIHESPGDKVFHILNITLLAAAGCIVLFPLLYAVACSFSSTQAIIQNKVFFWPVDFTLDSYSAVLQYNLITSGFLNSLLYAALGTLTAVALLLLSAYPLSRPDLPGRKIFIVFFMVTMFFSGGMIPNYMLMRDMHLINTRWALMIAFSFSCYNMIIVRSYFQTSLPTGILDAAHIDGCNDLRFFLKMALPLAKPVIAVMVLFNMVGIWNSYMNAMLYTSDPNLYPLQMVLRDILFVAQMPAEMRTSMDPSKVNNMQDLLQQLRYAVLVVGALPMMAVYPFVQKFFIKGMLIGSLKE